eukprot:m.46849 g.46849  ORF g.46849 m.46849 type:complete len:635 (+) comp8804_c0_seq1:264-2168(+)
MSTEVQSRRRRTGRGHGSESRRTRRDDRGLAAMVAGWNASDVTLWLECTPGLGKLADPLKGMTGHDLLSVTPDELAAMGLRESQVARFMDARAEQFGKPTSRRKKDKARRKDRELRMDKSHRSRDGKHREHPQQHTQYHLLPQQAHGAYDPLRNRWPDQPAFDPLRMPWPHAQPTKPRKMKLAIKEHRSGIVIIEDMETGQVLHEFSGDTAALVAGKKKKRRRPEQVSEQVPEWLLNPSAHSDPADEAPRPEQISPKAPRHQRPATATDQSEVEVVRESEDERDSDSGWPEDVRDVIGIPPPHAANHGKKRRHRKDARVNHHHYHHLEPSAGHPAASAAAGASHGHDARADLAHWILTGTQRPAAAPQRPPSDGGPHLEEDYADSDTLQRLTPGLMGDIARLPVGPVDVPQNMGGISSDSWEGAFLRYGGDLVAPESGVTTGTHSGPFITRTVQPGDPQHDETAHGPQTPAQDAGAFSGSPFSDPPTTGRYQRLGPTDGADSPSPQRQGVRGGSPIYLTPAQIGRHRDLDPQGVADETVDPAEILRGASDHEYLLQPNQLSVVSGSQVYTVPLNWTEQENDAPRVQLQGSTTSFRNTAQLVSYYRKQDFLRRAEDEGRAPELPTHLGTIRENSV